MLEQRVALGKDQQHLHTPNREAELQLAQLKGKTSLPDLTAGSVEELIYARPRTDL
jgi:hypothetical protein